MKTLRKIHLYLGCFFAPLLIMFVITGALQTFNLHHSWKNKNYTAPPIVKTLSQVHTDQRYITENNSPEPSVPFKILVVLMSLGLLVTTILGVVLAFRVTKNKLLIWGSLLGGLLIPIFFLWMARGFK